jgi:hypothetical protein
MNLFGQSELLLRIEFVFKHYRQLCLASLRNSLLGTQWARTFWTHVGEYNVFNTVDACGTVLGEQHEFSFDVSRSFSPLAEMQLPCCEIYQVL